MKRKESRAVIQVHAAMYRQYPLTDRIKIQRIPYCRNSYKIQEKNRRTRQTDTTNAQIHDRSLSCFGTCASMQTGGVKLVYWPKHPILAQCLLTMLKRYIPLNMNQRYYMYIYIYIFFIGSLLKQMLHRSNNESEKNWYT
jgi:hypothetical protein